ncbi:glycosyltransferase [Shewanella saliphila]|uniref:Glycosyl transferase n=1 Tax=Shewanella saliphila TaxID=2282698 RepID=A0ABQ2Q5B0_9GAMM|nr:glycosyltransferase [Shewanella saliphila]MCL1101334.1 glycosyltransferase [Shewanella saliphila]GGP50189.1 glycosyl transferase [Shewanella saliphila]
MSLNLASKSQFILQSSSPLPSTVSSVCGMSVYMNDRLEWVTQAVDSVLNQTLSPSLFVVVLDGNVSEEISLYLSKKEKQHPNMILVHGLVNRGLSVCMNYIIEMTLPLKPKYFFRMDADDICVPHRFEKQITLLEKHPDVDILGSALWEIDETGNRVGIRRLPLTHSKLLKSFSRRCPINHPTVAIRFSVFERGHRYMAEMLNTQDYFLWIALAKDGCKFANVREPLLHFRRINGFYKRRGRGKSVNEFKARLLAMESLSQRSLQNYCYALMVLTLRMMPAWGIKFAYKCDRFLLNLKRHH